MQENCHHCGAKLRCGNCRTSFTENDSEKIIMDVRISAMDVRLDLQKDLINILEKRLSKLERMIKILKP